MGARILVADDSVTIQKVVELTFSKEDFVLIPVRSGEEAIRKAKEVQPDLILLDLVMPDKNGYEVCTALRAEPMLRAVPIIMLTGTFEAFDKEQGLRAGANDFLTKPFESQALISRVKQLLFSRTVDIGGPAAPAPAPPAPAATAPPPPPPAEAPQPAPAVAPPSPPKPSAAPAIPKVPPTLRPARPISRPVTAPTPAPPVSAAPPGKPAPPSPPPGLKAPPSPAPAVPAQAGKPPALELPSLELESIPEMPKTAGADASRIPQTLSLEELLGPGPVPPPPAALAEPPSGVTAESAAEPTAEATPIEALRPEGEAVFDFTADVQGPSPPQVEVGIEKPPAPPVEEIRDRAEVTPAPPSAAGPPEPVVEASRLEGLVAADEPVFDLTADMQGPSLPLVEVGKGEPPELAIEDLLRPPGAAPIESRIEEVPELQLEPAVESQPESAVPSPEVPSEFELAIEIPPEPPTMTSPPPGPVEIGDLVRAAVAPPPPAVMAEILATPAPSEAVEAPSAPPPQVDVLPVAPLPPTGPATEAAPPAAPLTPEMGALRQAVTERVAHELAKELSSQLIERIERIVWEVVPDMAEILINREIERLRTMAEGKQPS
jgi:CheY-like chemotaxis protein